jgi:hypothetical protein
MEVVLASVDAVRLATERANNCPLDFSRWSDVPAVEACVDQVYREMELEGLTPKRQARYQGHLRDHLKVILLDLYAVYRSDPARYLSFYRSPRGYQKPKLKSDFHKRYSQASAWVSFDYVKRVTDFLERSGYIEKIILGYRNPQNPDKSKLSLMRATDKLFQLMRQDHKVLLPMVKPRDGDRANEVIILKGAKKDGEPRAKPKAYRDNDDTRRMRSNLDQINQLLEQFSILLEISDEELRKLHQRIRNERDSTIDPEKKRGLIDFSRKSLRRIFNDGSFDFGGRFYGGWWQNIPREFRPFIRLDSKDVVECDYSGLHVNMLYALERLEKPEGDVYELPEYTRGVRQYLKRLLLVLINSESPRQARNAMLDRRDPDFTELPDEVESLDAIFTSFCNKHRPIRHYFCSGIGIWLQNLDSQIAEKVMMAFVEIKFAILPMHDSFIVHHGMESFLQEQMNKAFEDLMGMKCRVDLKYNSISERHKALNGATEVVNTSLRDLLRMQRLQSVYEDLLSEHWQFRDQEYKRRLRRLQEKGINPFEGTSLTIEDVLNDTCPEDPFNLP